MNRLVATDDLHVEFLCKLDKELLSGPIPRDRLAALLMDCPDDLRDRWLANAKVVVLLNQIWPQPRRPV